MKKGYKATRNMTCRNTTYEVGVTYEMKGDIQICRRGYHYCEKMVDILNYYSPSKDFVVIEIEDLGDQSYTSDDKTVTNKMKVVRVVPPEEYVDFKFNSNNNLVYKKISDDHEFWSEYNDDGIQTSFLDSTGYGWVAKHDSNGNIIHYKCSNGFEYWSDYDSDGNKIYYKDSNGYEEWSTFAAKYRCLTYKNSEGFSWEKEYDSNGNCIHYKDSKGYEEWKEYTYTGLLKYYRNNITRIEGIRF